MAVGKEIIVLMGGGHKGVVKICGGADGVARISCSLDFRPVGASLYVVGNSVVRIPLDDVRAEAETKLDMSEKMGCVLRSSSLTMFGGNIAKSELLSRVEAFGRAAKPTLESAQKSKILQTNDSIEVNKAEEAKAAERDISPLGDWTKYDGNNFYYAVKPQIDEMFVCYPTEKALESAVQNSRFIRVDADDGYYVVGILYDDSEPAFICYGVPERAGDTHKAPDELADMCVWLPLVGDGISGYWIIYQSAKTGEIIK